MSNYLSKIMEYDLIKPLLGIILSIFLPYYMSDDLSILFENSL